MKRDDAPIRVVDVNGIDPSDLRLPDPERDSQAPLASANTRGVDIAVAALAILFPGMPLGRFTQATDASTLVAASCLRGLVDQIGARPMLDRVLRQLSFVPPHQLRLVRDREARDLGDLFVRHERPAPEGHVRVRPAALARALDEGYTVVLDGVELRDLASVRLTDLVERAFGTQVNINGYLSARTSTSFGAHWDDQEVIILQLIGCKQWQVEQPVALSPLRASHGEATSGEVAWTGRMHPGDALYLPRGWGHVVSGVDELTYHYTITIPRLNGVTALGSVLDDLSTRNDGRDGSEPLPMSPGRARVAAGLDLDDAGALASLGAAIARTRFQITNRSTPRLRSTVALLRGGSVSAVGVRSSYPGGWVVAGDQDGEVLAGMGGTMVAVPEDRVGEVGAVTDGGIHLVSEVEPGLLRGLVAAGLLEVVDDPCVWNLAEMLPRG